MPLKYPLEQRLNRTAIRGQAETYVCVCVCLCVSVCVCVCATLDSRDGLKTCMHLNRVAFSVSNGV